ncbi:type II toxin-antitoxin system RelE/ParE family toxin [Duganella vulcania]|uniref:Type II toxin-antitoxin system RelE/ParE family toxin n=1 Tax=Duganella vulcania TaxID=2692166 RepID=A0A845GNR7_9BURK|nr:type II toxin-antitoxin system RelE/ParE family toxin [Duganella vulcania]MYM95641.1 type II toxin-antitoxin system RelE/ParE family toxin [Duganella vulcania]
MFTVVIRPRAAADFEASYDYYARVASPSVAENFSNDFQSVCDLIASLPEIGSRRFAHLFPGKNLRSWSLHRFPVRVFYLVHGKQVEIVAIEHERREPLSTSGEPDN